MALRQNRSMSRALSAPKVRAACEACHQRKIRCEMCVDGRCCQACEANGRKCYFIPRAKAGRPRIVRHSRSDQGVYSPTTCMSSDDPGGWQTTTMTNSIISGTDSASSLDWSDFSSFGNMHYFSDGCDPTFSGPQVNFYQYNSDTQDVDGSTSCSVKTSIETSSPTLSDFQPTTIAVEKTSNYSGFTTLLHICAELQDIQQNTGISGIPTSSGGCASRKLQSVLQTLDATGDTILDTISQISNTLNSAPNTVSSISALAVATLLKLLEICDTFVQRGGSLHVQTLGQVQLLKRIDFNVLQTRTALTQVERLHPAHATIAKEALTIASHLRSDIKSALERVPTAMEGIF